jgi:hypothetical protein
MLGLVRTVRGDQNPLLAQERCLRSIKNNAPMAVLKCKALMYKMQPITSHSQPHSLTPIMSTELANVCAALAQASAKGVGRSLIEEGATRKGTAARVLARSAHSI